MTSLTLPLQPYTAAHHRKIRGFTLIELMVTVAIVGILASVAYPSYMSQVRKSRRSDAVQALAQVQQAQERYRSNKPAYATSLTELNTVVLPAISATTSGGYYTISITKPSGALYQAAATAVSGKSQTGDTNCTAITVRIADGTLSGESSGTIYNEPTSCWSK